QVQRLIRKIAIDIVVLRYGLESDELPQISKRLHFRKLRLIQVHLKLQQLQLYFQQVAFTHGARLIARFADLNGLLIAAEILLREAEVGLGEQRVYELDGN